MFDTFPHLHFTLTRNAHLSFHKIDCQNSLNLKWLIQCAKDFIWKANYIWKGFPSIHCHLLIWGRVAEAICSEEKPWHPSPQQHSASSGASRGIPRLQGTYSVVVPLNKILHCFVSKDVRIVPDGCEDLVILRNSHQAVRKELMLLLFQHLLCLIFGLIDSKFEISKLSQNVSYKSNRGSFSWQVLHDFEIYCKLLAKK